MTPRATFASLATAMLYLGLAILVGDRTNADRIVNRTMRNALSEWD